MELNLLSVLKSVTAIRCDVSAMSDSDVGDQQMLLTNFQYFDAVSLISTRGWYPVHERFPLSSSSSSASNHSGQCNDFHWFFLCRNTSRKSRVHPNCATLNIHFSQNLLIGQTTSVRCILCLFFSLITDISLVLSRCLMDNRNGIQPVNTLHQWLPTVLPWEWFCYQAYSGVIAGKIGRLNKKKETCMLLTSQLRLCNILFVCQRYFSVKHIENRVARWPSGWGAGLAINRSSVRIPADALHRVQLWANCLHVCLCHHAV